MYRPVRVREQARTHMWDTLMISGLLLRVLLLLHYSGHRYGGAVRYNQDSGVLANPNPGRHSTAVTGGPCSGDNEVSHHRRS